jgi:hypothetical protein
MAGRSLTSSTTSGRRPQAVAHEQAGQRGSLVGHVLVDHGDPELARAAGDDRGLLAVTRSP